MLLFIRNLLKNRFWEEFGFSCAASDGKVRRGKAIPPRMLVPETRNWRLETASKVWPG
jgi:hypothetical protein